MSDLAARAATLLELHRAPEALAFGYEDGERIPLELHLDMVGRIVRAVDLPVTMDLEAGYGDAGATARRAIEVGVVGGNLEDQLRPLGVRWPEPWAPVVRGAT